MVTGEEVLKHTPIDEVELALRITEQNFPEIIKDKNSAEISDVINKKFGINSTGEDIFLLYEPTIDTNEQDMRIHFEAMGLNY